MLAEPVAAPARFRVGSDTSKVRGAVPGAALETLSRLAGWALEGAFFRSAFDLSPTLDRAEISDVAQAAADLGLYLEVGIGKVNPYATPETPEIRAAGAGDYLAGQRRMIEVLAAAGIHTLWTATANYQFHLTGLRTCDRFRTDVTWPEQLAATQDVLRRLGPMLGDAGSRLCIETHEEISSFEVVRLVEEAGPERFGITFDTANVLVRGEDPLAAARRVAPYVGATHIRDVALARTGTTISRFVVPVGEGVIDWGVLLQILHAGGACTTLSIEGVLDSTAEMELFVEDPEWRASHPDLSDAELATVFDLTSRYEALARAGERPGVDELRMPCPPEFSGEFIRRSADHLRRIA